MTASGEERRLAWTSVIQQDANGQVLGFAAIAHDVTDVHRLEAERTLLASAVEQSAGSVIITDSDARITYVNPAFEHLTGYTSAEVIGQNPRILNSGQQAASFYKAMWAALTRGLPWVAEFDEPSQGWLALSDYLGHLADPCLGRIGQQLRRKRPRRHPRARPRDADRPPDARACAHR